MSYRHLNGPRILDHLLAGTLEQREKKQLRLDRRLTPCLFTGAVVETGIEPRVRRTSAQYRKHWLLNPRRRDAGS